MAPSPALRFSSLALWVHYLRSLMLPWLHPQWALWCCLFRCCLDSVHYHSAWTCHSLLYMVPPPCGGDPHLCSLWIPLCSPFSPSLHASAPPPEASRGCPYSRLIDFGSPFAVIPLYHVGSVAPASVFPIGTPFGHYLSHGDCFSSRAGKFARLC